MESYWKNTEDYWSVAEQLHPLRKSSSIVSLGAASALSSCSPTGRSTEEETPRGL